MSHDSQELLNAMIRLTPAGIGVGVPVATVWADSFSPKHLEDELEFL